MNEFIRVHSVMKNEPFDGRTSFVKKLKSSHRATSTLCFNMSSAHHINKKIIITIIAIIMIVIIIVLMIIIIIVIIIIIIMIIR